MPCLEADFAVLFMDTLLAHANIGGVFLNIEGGIFQHRMDFRLVSAASPSPSP